MSNAEQFFQKPPVLTVDGNGPDEKGNVATQPSFNIAVTIILQATGEPTDCTGCDVTVTNTEDQKEIKQFSYTSPETIMIPIGTHYRVHVGSLDKHATPADVEYTASGEPRTIIMQYQPATRYGFKRSKTNSNPSDRITYLYDAVDKTPMTVDLATGTPNYGDWKDFIMQLVRPVMLRTNGTVDYELERDNPTIRADNGLQSDVANTQYDGNAMVEFSGPFKWVHRSEEDDSETVIFCNVKYDDTYEAYAHTGEDGQVKDAFYWGMFKGTYVGTKMRSIGTGAIMVSTTRQQEVERAKANGSGYNTIYKSGWDYIADILTLISKSDNSQAVFGSGRCKSGNTAAIAAGTLKQYGAFYGRNDETTDVKALYIEGIWGNVWEGMAGCILDGAQGIKVKMTPPYNFDASGYELTGISPSGTSGGYVDTETVGGKIGYVPKTANGSNTTYTCDGLWYNNSQVDYAVVGGGWCYAGLCGSRCLLLNSLASNPSADVGSRLSYIPA